MGVFKILARSRSGVRDVASRFGDGAVADRRPRDFFPIRDFQTLLEPNLGKLAVSKLATEAEGPDFWKRVLKRNTFQNPRAVVSGASRYPSGGGNAGAYIPGGMAEGPICKMLLTVFVFLMICAVGIFCGFLSGSASGGIGAPFRWMRGNDVSRVALTTLRGAGARERSEWAFREGERVGGARLFGVGTRSVWTSIRCVFSLLKNKTHEPVALGEASRCATRPLPIARSERLPRERVRASWEAAPSVLRLRWAHPGGARLTAHATRAATPTARRMPRWRYPSRPRRVPTYRAAAAVAVRAVAATAAAVEAGAGMGTGAGSGWRGRRRGR